jgi:hypothetical protein
VPGAVPKKGKGKKGMRIFLFPAFDFKLKISKL